MEFVSLSTEFWLPLIVILIICYLRVVDLFFLVIYSLTGGIGAAGVSLPATSVIGAPGAASLLSPTVAAVGSVPGAPVLPVTTQNVIMSTPTEFLLLKNMFDPALEVFLFCTCVCSCILGMPRA
jgi:hypothetical protein